ncbi:MAG: hypothetical protein J0I06_03960 [Planctomycetes bacterium]|nr:hypothetical protein [Planctomycetota bacterium]
MGYWMRFFDTHKKPLKLGTLRSALRRIDRKFDLDRGQLTYDGADFAQVEISEPGDGTFDAELAEFRAAVEAKRGTKVAAAKAQVLETLDKTKRTIAVRVGGHGDALDLLDTLWDWLFRRRSGLLQADGEGFYQDEDLILPLK